LLISIIYKSWILQKIRWEFFLDLVENTYRNVPYEFSLVRKTHSGNGRAPCQPSIHLLPELTWAHFVDRSLFRLQPLLEG